jgi:hypothetical protein
MTYGLAQRFTFTSPHMLEAHLNISESLSTRPSQVAYTTRAVSSHDTAFCCDDFDGLQIPARKPRY